MSELAMRTQLSQGLDCAADTEDAALDEQTILGHHSIVALQAALIAAGVEPMSPNPPPPSEDGLDEVTDLRVARERRRWRWQPRSRPPVPIRVDPILDQATQVVDRGELDALLVGVSEGSHAGAPDPILDEPTTLMSWPEPDEETMIVDRGALDAALAGLQLDASPKARAIAGTTADAPARGTLLPPNSSDAPFPFALDQSQAARLTHRRRSPDALPQLVTVGSDEVESTHDAQDDVLDVVYGPFPVGRSRAERRAWMRTRLSA